MKRSRDGEERLNWKTPLLRGGIGIALLCVLLLILTALILHEKLPQGREGLICRLALLLAATCSGWLSAAGCRRRRLLCALLGEGALLLFVILLGVFTKDNDVLNISLLYSILTLIFGGFLGGVLASAGGRRRRKAR